MMLTLLRSIVKNKGYNHLDVANAYIAWANSNQPMMGRNTKDLFKGSSGKIQYKTYEALYNRSQP